MQTYNIAAYFQFHDALIISPSIFIIPTIYSGNDLLCQVHNPLKRLFGHEKNRQSADYRSRYRFF